MRSLRSILAGGAVGAVLAVAVFATPAAAAPTCSSGYVCLFNETNGSDGVRVAFQYGRSSYAAMTFYGSKIKLDNAVEAVHYNFQKVRLRFYTQAGYKGTRITQYVPGQQGFRNWTAANCNILSSHQEFKP